MKKYTLSFLRCAEDKKCRGDLLLEDDSLDEVLFGNLICKKCKTNFPILAGVAIVVPDVEGYLVHHVKGISKFVSDQQIPKQYRAAFLEAKSEIVEEYVEEDLESDRVNALYLMNHYLKVASSKVQWWRPLAGAFDPLMDSLVKKHWDENPFTVIAKWFDSKKKTALLDLGCGVGGLYHHVSKNLESYLGVDSSFQSILLARHLNLGTPYTQTIKIPEDLIQGAVSREIENLDKVKTKNKNVDFIVGVIDLLPLKNNLFDVSVSMNTIDMLDDPRVLPEVQHKLLKHGGRAIQCGPYIWHAQVAKHLQSILPKSVKTSSQATEAIYKKAGFKIDETIDHIPWLFFKHVRQIELYSVHAFIATKV